MKVTKGEPEELYLLIKNEGAKFKPGETFDVSVKAMEEEREVSGFTVKFEVGEEEEEPEEGKAGPEEAK